jgi:hypothetical protein
MFQNHANAHEWVFIPCCGAGAEVEGALLAGLNVVCCDILPSMFTGTVQRLEALQAKFDKADWNLADHLAVAGPEEEGDGEEGEIAEGEAAGEAAGDGAGEAAGDAEQ